MNDHSVARQSVIEEAHSWVGTPYHPHGRLKGVGCDCLTFVVQVFENVDVIPHFEIPYYNPSFHLHHSEELYLNGILSRCAEITKEALLPADIVLFKFGRVFSHGAIIIKWPDVMHAYMMRPVTIDNVDNTKWLSVVGEQSVELHGKPRPMRFFRPNSWMA